MKKTINTFIIFIIACSFFSCSEEIQQTNALLTQSEQPVRADLQQPAIKKAEEWPFIKDDSDNTESISDNLTAKNYLLIFDGSGSMGEVECGDGQQKIDVAKKAVMEWASVLPKDSNLGIVAFYYNKWATLPLTSGNRDNFMRSIQEVVAGGRTPLTEAMLRSYKTITSEGKKQLGYGEYTIVVVTDGIANDRNTLSEAISKILDNSPVNIYTIGFCIGQNHSLNQPGRTVYKSADNPEELKKGLNEVLAESDTFDEAEFN